MARVDDPGTADSADGKPGEADDQDDDRRPVQRHLADEEEPQRHRSRAASGAPAGGEAVDDMFSAAEIFQRVAATADSEFQRQPRMLLFSGVAAGISLGVTFLARASLGGETGSGPGLPADLLYPLGFVLVVLGGYQLFTENTLTPVTLVLSRLASIPALLRLWGIVIVGNLLGAAGFALLLSGPDALPAEHVDVARELAAELLHEPVDVLFVRSVLAGVLVASMVWMVHAVRDGMAKIVVIYGVMLLIPVAALYHCVTGFTEAMFGVFEGEGSVGQAVVFFLVVAGGNTLGGVGFVAIVNHAQIAHRRLSEGDDDLRLGWRPFLLGVGGPHADGELAPELNPDAEDHPAHDG